MDLAMSHTQKLVSVVFGRTDTACEASQCHQDLLTLADASDYHHPSQKHSCQTSLSLPCGFQHSLYEVQP